MKAIWKGDISFGLVTIPVQIIPVEEKKDLHFHLLDARDKSRIRYKRVNSNTDKEVPWDKIVKGYEFDKGNYIIVDEKAFEEASPEVYKSIDIEEFIELDEIDSLYFDKPYYIVPDSKNQKAYVLLREALKKTRKVGVAKAMIRTKEYLCLVMPHENALVLNLIRFQQEIRPEDDLKVPTESLRSYKISEREMKMATELIKDMTAPWKPEKYHDDYQEALTKWIEKKSAEAEKEAGKKTRERVRKPDDVVDFITLLKKSMGKDKKGKQSFPKKETEKSKKKA
ncbi:Ku protein [Legionella jamestowniensis]|uniref:Non-homologous end joining protein Ku n=1 Tax=Legionella jamestowniensis TaxID=455 RepID=A0A0W0UI43_9GAMM|nr:Ku protein [Legionella jamestowniensis]KTD07552.1 putative DNA repair protein YkoV [Legionella jamestowniensis]OCH97679.1 Ku protein [Legionella jamestowniensis]SFM01665.1 DNA end-binding protein Ku [Legionella jamestowniensis DSM 19215]